MRRKVTLILSMLIVSTAAVATDWDQMNGYERRSYVAAFVGQSGLVCSYPSQGGPAGEAAKLAKTSWWKVLIGVKIYCQKGEKEPVYVTQQKQKVLQKPGPVPRVAAQQNPPAPPSVSKARIVAPPSDRKIEVVQEQRSEVSVPARRSFPIGGCRQ